jgi:hypothetical protein
MDKKIKDKKSPNKRLIDILYSEREHKKHKFRKWIFDRLVEMNNIYIFLINWTAFSTSLVKE